MELKILVEKTIEICGPGFSPNYCGSGCSYLSETREDCCLFGVPLEIWPFGAKRCAECFSAKGPHSAKGLPLPDREGWWWRTENEENELCNVYSISKGIFYCAANKMGAQKGPREGIRWHYIPAPEGE